jgi:hypothetical protein
VGGFKEKLCGVVKRQAEERKEGEGGEEKSPTKGKLKGSKKGHPPWKSTRSN